eukprot:TRINITY_DN8437_c0_g1_i1.p1 TRINITY_DN8437_c0_g1~~TRINITY_DN8437_c0_g1_i1.p1  ORF type:complete len:591 (-),score=157.10 TRINITY_DN8437_c0_g1_i1:15-1787(-)
MSALAKQLRSLEDQIDERQTELEMTGTLLRSMTADRKFVALAMKERQLADKEMELAAKEKANKELEEQLTQSEARTRQLELNVKMMQRRDRDIAIIKKKTVHVQTDGGRDADEADYKEQSGMRSEVVQYRARVDALKAEELQDQRAVARIREVVAECSQALLAERSNLEQHRAEVREAELRLVTAQAEYERVAAATEHIKKRREEMAAQVVGLQGPPGTLAYRRMTIDNHHELLVELGEKQALRRQIDDQLDSAELALNADRELQQRRAALASLQNLQERHKQTLDEIAGERALKALAQHDLDEFARTAGHWRMESETHANRTAYAMAFMLAIRRYQSQMEAIDRKIGLRKKIEQSFETTLQSRRQEASLFGIAGVVAELKEEYTRLQTFSEQRRGEIHELEQYVHVSHLAGKRTDERRALEAQINAITATNEKAKALSTKLRLQSELQEAADRVLNIRRTMEPVITDSNNTNEELTKIKLEIRQARETLRKVRLEAAEVTAKAAAAALMTGTGASGLTVAGSGGTSVSTPGAATPMNTGGRRGTMPRGGAPIPRPRRVTQMAAGSPATSQPSTRQSSVSSAPRASVVGR